MVITSICWDMGPLVSWLYHHLVHWNCTAKHGKCIHQLSLISINISIYIHYCPLVNRSKQLEWTREFLSLSFRHVLHIADRIAPPIPLVNRSIKMKLGNFQKGSCPLYGILSTRIHWRYAAPTKIMAYYQWPFQEPKLEVPNIYKAYKIRPKFQGISPQCLWPEKLHSTSILGSWNSHWNYEKTAHL